MFPNQPSPPGVRPVDATFVDADGTVWVWFAPQGTDIQGAWTATEPVDKARWAAIMAGTFDTVSDPSDVRGRVSK
jgi:hypothetical protein